MFSQKAHLLSGHLQMALILKHSCNIETFSSGGEVKRSTTVKSVLSLSKDKNFD